MFSRLIDLLFRYAMSVDLADVHMYISNPEDLQTREVNVNNLVLALDSVFSGANYSTCNLFRWPTATNHEASVILRRAGLIPDSPIPAPRT